MESNYPENEGVGRKEPAPESDASSNPGGADTNPTDNTAESSSSASAQGSQQGTQPPVQEGPTDTQRLRNFRRKYGKVKVTRPSRLRATAFYGVLRVIGWIGMVVGVLVALSGGVLPNEWAPVYDVYIEILAEDIESEQVLSDLYNRTDKNQRIDFYKRICSANCTKSEFIGSVQWCFGLFALFSYFLAFLSRRIIRRNFYILRVERAIQEHLIP